MYERKPSGMAEYLAAYGWHFSKLLAQSAVDRYGGAPMMSARQWEEKTRGMDAIQKAKGYDAQYLFCKFRHDFPDFSEIQVLRMVCTFLENNYEEAALTHYYADCIACDVPVIWEDAI